MSNLNLKGTGDRIRVARGKLSQADFAKVLGIGLSTLRRYESGERGPDAEVLLRLAEVGHDPTWILLGRPSELNEKSDQIGTMSLDERMEILSRASAKVQGILRSRGLRYDGTLASVMLDLADLCKVPDHILFKLSIGVDQEIEYRIKEGPPTQDRPSNSPSGEQ